jgi:small subunit ribosomal protein S16
VGKKKQPYYRIVAADSKSPRNGRFIETIGFYDPSKESIGQKLTMAKDKLDSWLKKGAKPTESLQRLLKQKG